MLLEYMVDSSPQLGLFLEDIHPMQRRTDIEMTVKWASQQIKRS